MKNKILAVLALTFYPALAQAQVGFQNGNELLSSYIEGEISLSCNENGMSDYANFRCSAEILDPSEFDYFRGPAGVNADKVFLKATRADGSIREKNGSYDSEAGRSSSRFNLWISTVLQRPLLKLGANQVEYRMEKDGQTVDAGNFLVQVNRGEDRSCRYRRHYFSSNMNDCRTGGTYCDRYFSEENYCQR